MLGGGLKLTPLVYEWVDSEHVGTSTFNIALAPCTARTKSLDLLFKVENCSGEVNFGWICQNLAYKCQNLFSVDSTILSTHLQSVLQWFIQILKRKKNAKKMVKEPE